MLKLSKSVFFAALAAFPLLFPGCPRGGPVPAASGLAVTATIFPLYDFARAVGGDRVSVTMLLPPASESHSFEPAPRDIIGVRNSALFLTTGGESEAWAERILGSVEGSGVRALRLMDAVEAVEEETVEGMEAEAEAEEEGPAYDEHIWTSPRNAKLMVAAIAEALAEIDGENAAYYRENAAACCAEFDALDAAFRDVLDNARRRVIVFGDRFPFRYFAAEYGLSYFAAFPGCSTETEPAAATVAFLVEKVRAEGIPVIFHIELSNEKMADTIAEATGAEKRLFHAGHNVTRDDFERGATFIELWRGNVDALRAALR